MQLRKDGLGWFSLALGTAQLVAPRAVAEMVGWRAGPRTAVLMRLLGAREVMAGLGVLREPRGTGWLWARVAGDAMDLGLLGLGLTSKHNDRGRVAASMALVGGVTLADVTAAEAQARGSGATQQLHKAITINAQPTQVYPFWRDFRHFPSFMSHVESVAVMDDRSSHWTVRAPAGRTVEWDAEITQDRPNELIAWRSRPGAEVENSGTVRFSAGPGGRGTEVRVEMSYAPPGGALGASLARLFGQEPSQQVQADLRKLKQMIETGEVIRNAATRRGTQVVQQAAQPAGVGRAS